jgi:addiction module RelB/DinJ family antitoxin
MKKKMTASLTVRLDHDLKVESEKILESLGIKSADAVRTLYRQIVLHQGLPYALKLPEIARSEDQK